MAGKNPLVPIILIVACVIAIASVGKRIFKKGPSAGPKATHKIKGGKLYIDWICDKGYKFTAPRGENPVKCPKHGDLAGMQIFYYCSVHDHEFEAYRVRATRMQKGKEAGLHAIADPAVRTPDNPEWKKWDKNKRPKIICPHGNSNPATLKHARPYNVL